MKPAKAARLILASGSPRRRELMQEAGYRFIILPSNARETKPRGLGPSAVVRHLAVKKAVAVARANPHDVVIGADTLVWIGGKVLGKPASAAHARRMLSALSGRWQRVYTGVAVAQAGGKTVRSDVAVSYVLLRRLSSADIERACSKHMDKAGAYAAQEKEDPFVERIRGDYDNVVGLPMRVVRRLLGRAGQGFAKTIRR